MYMYINILRAYLFEYMRKNVYIYIYGTSPERLNNFFVATLDRASHSSPARNVNEQFSNRVNMPRHAT